MENKRDTRMVLVYLINLPTKLYQLRNSCILSTILSFFLTMLPAMQYTPRTHYEFPIWEKEKGMNQVFSDLVGIRIKN